MQNQAEHLEAAVGTFAAAEQHSSQKVDRSIVDVCMTTSPGIWSVTRQKRLSYGLSIAAMLPALTIEVQAGAKKRGDVTCPAILSHSFNRLQDEAPQDPCQFAGKRVVLIVNTASYLGFTGQYEGLEALYSKYQARGFVVLGFP